MWVSNSVAASETRFPTFTPVFQNGSIIYEESVRHVEAKTRLHQALTCLIGVEAEAVLVKFEGLAVWTGAARGRRRVNCLVVHCILQSMGMPLDRLRDATSVHSSAS